MANQTTPKVLLISGTGFLGSHLPARLRADGIDFVASSRAATPALNLERPIRAQLGDWFAAGRFTHGVICAAQSDVESCFRDPVLSRRINVDAVAELQECFTECGVKPVFFSSDMVFDCTREFRGEEEAPSPTTEYGRQKTEAERRLRESGEHLIFRTSKLMAMYPHPRNILSPLVAAARGEPFRAFRDQFITPVFVEDVGEALVRALRTQASGTFHLAGERRLSRVELAREVCRFFGGSGEAVEETSIRDAMLSEPRGFFHTLSAEKARKELGMAFTPLEEGLKRLLAAISAISC
ncbi:MAG: SDR family oxidoreductase [Bdellovibrionota bacterium]